MTMYGKTRAGRKIEDTVLTALGTWATQDLIDALAVFEYLIAKDIRSKAYPEAFKKGVDGYYESIRIELKKRGLNLAKIYMGLKPANSLGLRNLGSRLAHQSF